MIITIQQLKDKYKDYVDINGKISRDLKSKKLFSLVKGVYETDATVDGIKLAQFIYAPSYISFDYAMSKYGLIPERVYDYTCATYNKRKKKVYSNHFGTYTYRDVPKEVFKLGIIIKIDGNYSYHIATPEKALCDKLYTISPRKNINELKELLFDDLRIDKNEFYKLNKDDLLKLAIHYHTNNLNLLTKLIKGE